MSIVRSGAASIDAPSAGRTSMPYSSIHTAIGTLLNPNSSSSRWAESISEGCVGAATSIHG